MSVFSAQSVTGTDHVQTAYKGKDNPIEVVLKCDDKEYDYSKAKTVRAKIGDVVMDSDADLDAFDRTEAETGKLRIYIGDQVITPRAYNVKIEVVDADDRVYYFGHVRVRIDDPGM